MDEDGAYDCAYANQQRKKDRELMILRHFSSTTSTTDSNPLDWDELTAILPTVLRTVQSEVLYDTRSPELALLGPWEMSDQSP
jgi:hypothetical protein